VTEDDRLVFGDGGKAEQTGEQAHEFRGVPDHDLGPEAGKTQRDLFYGSTRTPLAFTRPTGWMMPSHA
jgi:hypothetical protein